MVVDGNVATRVGEGSAARTKKQIQTEVTRDKICDAVISCLDEFGYAETSINRVQERAQVSRGALTHHFPSKEDLMVATMRHLFKTASKPAGRKGRQPRTRQDNKNEGGVQRDLIRLWERIVNTKEGRASMEILVAARTDRQLHARISPELARYNDNFNHEVIKLYRSAAFDDDDVIALWTICRVFLRGLHIQERFESKPGCTSKLMKRFAKIMAPHLSYREPR